MSLVVNGMFTNRLARALALSFTLLLVICFQVSPLLANGGDTCPGPLITSLPYIDSTGNTTNMNPDYSHCGISVPPGSRDVVYSLYLPCDTWVTSSLCGSALSSWILVRTGGSCPGDSVVGCDNSACGNVRGQVTFLAHGNTYYYMIVSGRCTALQCYYGSFILTVTGAPLAPANDVCPGTLISSVPYTDTGSNCIAQANYPYCDGSYYPDVVYTLNIPDCEMLTISTCGSNFNTRLDVKAGGACPGNFNVICNDDNNSCGVFSVQSWLRFVAQANTNYYIHISGSSSEETGTYTLNVTGEPFVPPNDACPGTAFTSLPYGDFGNTGCATTFTYNHCGGGFAPDVVYSMTLTGCERVFAFTCNSGFDTRLDVRAGGDCPGSVLITCNDDSAYCSNYGNAYGSAVVFNAYAGVTYYFIVHGYSAASGPFAFQAISLGGFNSGADMCPGAPIGNLPFTAVGSTICMSHEFDNCLASSSPDGVYWFQVSGCDLVTASLCGSGFDTGLTIRRGGSCPGATLVACNDDNYCGSQPTLQSTVSFLMTPNIPYYIIVHGYSNNAGPYVLHVTGAACDSTARVDSLVILPSSSSIYLEWKSQGPAYWYKVYRATTPDVPLNTTTYIDSTPNRYYVDAQVLNQPATRYFYAVTAATLPTLLDPGNSGDNNIALSKADALPTSAPTFTFDALPGSSSSEIEKAGPGPDVPLYIPAYQQYASPDPVNPVKHAAKPVR